MRWTSPLLGALLAAAACLAVGIWRGPQPIGGPIGDGSGFSRSRGWLITRGFSAPEFSPDTKEQFSWSGGRAQILVPRLNRNTAYQLALVVQAGRPGAQPELPTVRFRVDGVATLESVVGNALMTVVVDIPESATSSLRVDMDVAPTFVPSAEDRRQLGVVVRSVSLAPRPPRAFPVSWRSLGEATLGAALLSAILALFMMSGFVRLLCLGAIALASALFFWYDAAFLGTATMRLVWTGATTCGLAIASKALLSRRPQWREDRGWQTAVALVWVVTGLKWWVFVHPQIPIGDALFHVHRAEWVWAGRYFFTSITPRPFFEFPYAIGFYVAAWPLSSWMGSLDGVLALRSLALLVDAAAVFALLAVVRRVWSSPAALVACAVAYSCCRMSVQVLCAANLTNLFAQALFTIAIALLALVPIAPRRLATIVAASLGLTASFLSHFSTLLVGVPTTAVIAAGLWWRGDGDRKRLAWTTVAVLAISLVVSYGVYYSHFHEVYATTFARVMAREGEAATRSIAAPPSVKAVRLTNETVRNFGWPLIATSVLGVACLARSRSRDALRQMILTWTCAWVLLTVLGVLTAVELRANLSFEPVIAILAAAAVAWLWQKPLAGPAAATGVVLIIAVDGIREWIACVTGTP